jgi:hypothetical protein
MAQEITAPPPPPKEGTAPPPPPGGTTAPPPAPGIQPPAANVPRVRQPDRQEIFPAAPKDVSAKKRSSKDTATQGATGRQQAAGQTQPEARSQAAASTSSGASRKRGLYGGLTAGISFPTYDSADSDGIKPEFGGFIGWHLAKLGIQIEALAAFDKAYTKQTDFESVSLLLPIIGKYDIAVKSFVIQPLVGAYFNIALGDMDGRYKGSGTYHNKDGHTSYANPPLGIMVGSDFGWALKKGMIFLDARFAFDLGKTVIAVNGSEEELWRKTAFTLSLGYQFN